MASLQVPRPALVPADRTPSGRRRLRRWLVAGAAVALIVATVADAGTASAGAPAGPAFGPNVRIFDPSMPLADIQATVDAIAAQQVDNEMGTQRYALLFKP